MENDLIKEINIEEKRILHFSSFMLQQQFNAHHYFELRFNDDQLSAPKLISLDESREFIGKTLSATFGYTIDKVQQFAGIVTKVELAQSNGYHGTIIVSGYSPTVLIDRGPDLGSYLNKDLDSIVKLATNDTPANDLRIVANSARKTSIDYVIQYRESDFDFLNRLSAAYFEWFYYDGQSLNFGKPDKQKEVSLFYGRDVHSLQYAMEVAPIKNKRFAYNPKQDEMLQSESSGQADGRPDLVHAINASNLMYSKTFNQPASVRVDNGSDIKSQVDNEEKANISGLLKVTGSGDNPEVGIGSIAEITMSIRQELAFVTSSLGKFLITSVRHEIDGTGHYFNSFEGLVSTTERLQVKNALRPQPDMQLADVVDNDDPQGQGRVKVQFKWECQSNDPTEWLRVVSPNAGKGDTGANRGFHVIPEKGDQVVIAFEEGNIARPVVLGSVYHGKSGDSKGFKNSNKKGLTSRKGSALQFDDELHTLNLGTSGKNSLNIKESDEEITLTAGKKITIQVGAADKEGGFSEMSSITLNVDGSVKIKGTAIYLEGTTNQGSTGLINMTSDELINMEAKNKTVCVKETISMESKTISSVGQSKVVIHGGEVDIN